MRGWLVAWGVGLFACSGDGGASRLVDAEDVADVADVADSDAVEDGDVGVDSEDDAVDAGDGALDLDSEDVAALDVPDGDTDADGADGVDAAWREDIPIGDFTVSFDVHGELVACQPNCIQPLGTTLSFSLTLHVPDAGVPSLVLRRSDWQSPATDALADGTFVVPLQVVQTAAENAIVATGRIGPGRALTVDEFQHLIIYTNGFMAGWTSTATTTEPATQSF